MHYPSRKEITAFSAPQVKQWIVVLERKVQYHNYHAYIRKTPASATRKYEITKHQKLFDQTPSTDEPFYFFVVVAVFVELVEDVVLVELVVVFFPPLSSLVVEVEVVLDLLVLVAAAVVADVTLVAGEALDKTDGVVEEELLDTVEPELELDDVLTDVIRVLGPVVCVFQ